MNNDVKQLFKQVKNSRKYINYGKYIGESLDRSISYSEYISSEYISENIQYSPYKSEVNLFELSDEDFYKEIKNSRRHIRYSDYICENLNKSINYLEYVSEHIDTISYTDYLAESLSK
jgi:hypothetical protein